MADNTPPKYRNADRPSGRRQQSPELSLIDLLVVAKNRNESDSDREWACRELVVGHRSPDASRQAAQCLRSLTCDTQEPLRVRVAALDALPALHEYADNMPALLHELLTVSEPAIRYSAAKGFGVLTRVAKDALPRLLEVVVSRDQHAHSRQAAAQSIVTLLLHDRQVTRLTEVDLTPVSDLFAQVLTNIGAADQLRSLAARAIGLCGLYPHSVVTALSTAAEDKAENVRRETLRTLSESGQHFLPALRQIWRCGRHEVIDDVIGWLVTLLPQSHDYRPSSPGTRLDFSWAVPHLVSRLNPHHDQRAVDASGLLRRIGVSALPELNQKLKQSLRGGDEYEVVFQLIAVIQADRVSRVNPKWSEWSEQLINMHKAGPLLVELIIFYILGYELQKEGGSSFSDVADKLSKWKTPPQAISNKGLGPRNISKYMADLNTKLFLFPVVDTGQNGSSASLAGPDGLEAWLFTRDHLEVINERVQWPPGASEISLS